MFPRAGPATSSCPPSRAGRNDGPAEIGKDRTGVNFGNFHYFYLFFFACGNLPTRPGVYIAAAKVLPPSFAQSPIRGFPPPLRLSDALAGLPLPARASFLCAGAARRERRRPRAFGLGDNGEILTRILPVRSRQNVCNSPEMLCLACRNSPPRNPLAGIANSS
jgi:hypothetical protein